MKKEFAAWSEKRSDVVTPENYCDRTVFDAVAAGFPEAVNNPELNPELPGPMAIWDIMTGKSQGYFYPAVGQPNFTQLETRVGALETAGMDHQDYYTALVFPRGMAAIMAVLKGLSSKANGAFVRSKVVYSSTVTDLDEMVGEDGKGLGRCRVGCYPSISADKTTDLSVDLTNPNNLVRVLEQERAKGTNILGVVMEPVANPTIVYSDVRAVADIAHSFGVPVVVDNTFLTPFLYQPLRAGADIVVHSLTKYYSGEGDILGGAAIMPVEFYPAIRSVRKEEGFTPSPYDCFRLAQRVGGVGERIEKSSQNARQMAEALGQVQGIRVNYNRLDGITRDGHAGGVLSFEFEGEPQEANAKSVRFTNYLVGNRVVDGQKVGKHAVSLGEPVTLMVSFGAQLPFEKCTALNVHPSLVRIACGREDSYGRVADYVVDGIKRSL